MSERTANVFVTVKPKESSTDPAANCCWCHGENDTTPDGEEFIAVTSEYSDEVLEFCPKFFAEMFMIALGLHMGALQGNISAWPLTKVDLKKEALLKLPGAGG